MRYKILITPDKEKGKDDARLRCRVSFGGQIVALLVGYRVDVSKWSYDAQRCKANSVHNNIAAARINRDIDAIIKKIDSIFDRYEPKTREEFKRLYNGDNKTAEKTLNDYFDEFVTDKEIVNNWESGVIRQFNSLRAHLIGYDERLRLSAITADTLTQLTAYLVGLGLRNETTIKNLKRLRTFLFWAQDKGYITTDWTNYSLKLKTAPHKVVFLEWDELTRVYNAEIKAAYLSRVRDVFCFCCYTGLRYSDVYKLNKADIYDDRISITSIKDHDSLEINLNKYARAILDKYKDNDEVKALPVVSNAKYNLYIKEVAKVCEIDTPTTITYYIGARRHDEVKPKYELITTHTARRTFICNALALGISPNTIMKWTGHNDYKSMLPYIDIADETKRRAMELFDKK